MKEQIRPQKISRALASLTTPRALLRSPIEPSAFLVFHPLGMNHEKTLKLLTKALNIAPGDWETRSHMAALYLDLGMGPRAVALLEASPSLPDDDAGKLHAAELFARGGEDNTALRIADALIADNRANAKAHLLKAGIYRERGMKTDARKHYHIAAVIDASLEDAEFETWLDGMPPKRDSIDKSAARTAAAAETPPHPALRGDDPDSPFDFPNLPFDDFDPSPDPTPPGGNWVDETTELSAEMAAEFGEEPFDPFFINLHTPDTNFADIGGLEHIKERVRMKFIYPASNRSLFAKFNRKTGGGLLLYGPPGCGKTIVARAAAGESGARFVEISLSDLSGTWPGEGAHHIRNLFEAARSNSPAVVFIDDIDAIGERRSTNAMSGLLNALLGEMDGASSDNDGLLIIGTSSFPWDIDGALLRPGRFDQTLFVPPPDAAARASVFEILLREIPTTGIDVAELVAATDTFSGADLRAAIDAGIEMAIATEMQSGEDTRLSGEMLNTAIRSTHPTTLEWLEQATGDRSDSKRSDRFPDLTSYLKQHP